MKNEKLGLHTKNSSFAAALCSESLNNLVVEVYRSVSGLPVADEYNPYSTFAAALSRGPMA